MHDAFSDLEEMFNLILDEILYIVSECSQNICMLYVFCPRVLMET